MAKRKNGEGTYGQKQIKGDTYLFFRNADGKYFYAKTQKELKKKIEKEKEKEYFENPTNSLYTFGELCDYWLKHKKGLSSATYDHYEMVIRARINNYKKYNIGRIQSSSITIEAINDYLEELSGKYSKASINKTWTIIKQVLEFGIDRAYIPSLNLKKIEIPKEADVKTKKKIIKVITLEDMEILYKEAYLMQGERYMYGNAARMLVFIMYSGVRIGEAIALKWENVAPDYSYVRVIQSSERVIERDKDRNPILNENGKVSLVSRNKETKTENGMRSIPLPNRAKEVLKEFHNINPNHKLKDNVFINSSGNIYEKRGVERCLERMLNRSSCQCKDYTPHSLRHGYGSVLISKGVDIKIVSELLGHSDVSFTYNTYIGILKDDKIKAIRNVFD